MIVSRMAELARLDALLAGLVRGEGGALVVHGEAGIGKTTLLDALVERCGGAVTVVRACGAETEAQRAFSALTDLLYPVLRQLDALPAPQAAALMGALALEAPAPGDRLAVCVAALGMLRAEARRRPVLAVRPNSSGSAPRNWHPRSRRRSRRPRRATRWPWSSCPPRSPPASGPASRRSSSRSDRGTGCSARSRAGSRRCPDPPGWPC